MLNRKPGRKAMQRESWAARRSKRGRPAHAPEGRGRMISTPGGRGGEREKEREGCMDPSGGGMQKLARVAF